MACSSESKNGAAAPVVWKIILVQLFYWMGMSLTVTNYPLVWSDTTIAHGSDVIGGTLHATGVFINAGAEFLSASFLGALSDRHGRKIFLFLGCLGQVIDFGVGGLAANNRWDGIGPFGIAFGQRHRFLLSARLLAGLFGNVQIFTKSYVADISTPETSARNFAFLYACIGGSLVIGVPMGAILTKWIAIRFTMLIASGLNIVNLLVICSLEESLRPEVRREVEWRRANPVGGFNFLLSSRFLTLFGIMAFLDQFSVQLLSTLMIPYAKAVYHKKGLGVAAVIFLFAFFQVIVFLGPLPQLVRRMGELFVVKLGYCISSGAFAAFALASYSPLFEASYPCAIILACGMISGPTQTSIAIRCVSDSEQGTFQAANGSLDVVGKIASAALVAALFKPLVNIGQVGVIWWIACGVLLAGARIAFMLRDYLPSSVQDIDGFDSNDQESDTVGDSNESESDTSE